jgi:predicted nucleic acid-binding protein
MCELIAHHPMAGQRIFDVFLVATMLDHNVRIIYTQNMRDFAIFKDIQAVNPFESSPRPQL